MNEQKMNRLFEAAKGECPPIPSDDFSRQVMHGLPRRQPQAGSLLAQLDRLFPRLAWAAAGIIAFCVATDFIAGAADLPTVSDGVSQLSEQWQFTGEEF